MSARFLTYVLLAAVGIALAIAAVAFIDNTINELIAPMKGVTG